MSIPDKLPSIAQGQMEIDMRSKLQKKRMSPSSGLASYALGLAKVVTINYEEMLVTLRIVLGEDVESQRNPIPLTFPGAGKRHFFGAMPQVGDYCVVGWMPQESSGSGSGPGSKIPVILTWTVPGVWMGHDWMTSQPFTPDEWSFSPKDSSMVEGAFERVRHKLRHMQPGNITASSAQGSDLVLDEGVLLTNRRCNELRLRDQDQSFIVRSLQQFHAMAGARIYAGMVQRDARKISTQMISDGKNWTHPTQLNPDATPLHEADLLADIISNGLLTPAPILQKSFQNGELTDSWGPSLESSLDPYQILKRGLIISPEGFLISNDSISDATYGGKPIFRTSIPILGEPQVNPAVNHTPSLTEYRIEVNHTSDGTLPVTEQTDMFDADRLPDSDPTSGDAHLGSNNPFIQVVYGSVVGNDPFSISGKDLYGIPLKAILFDQEGNPNPQFISALGSNLGEHAATLFSLTPPENLDGVRTFWSLQKDGRLKFHIGGSVRQTSVEGILEGGLHLLAKGQTLLDFQGGLKLRCRDGDPLENKGLEISSEKGAVRIYGGGNLETGQVTERIASQDPNSSPSLQLEGRDTVEVKSSQNVFVRSSFVQTTGGEIRQEALSTLDMQSGDRIGIQSKTLDVNVSGKVNENFSGPKDLLPTSGPLRETNFSTTIPGLTVDKYNVSLGNREESFGLGNHSTTIKVGNMSYTTAVGEWKAQAGTNSLTVHHGTGLQGQVIAGNVLMEAKAGAVSISGTVSASVKTLGQATVSGTNGVYLGGGPVGKTGLIVSSADLDPLSGLPLQVYGMGSPAHRLGPPV